MSNMASTIAALKALALLGATRQFIQVSTKTLGESMGTSQQTAPNRIIMLADMNLIERRRGIKGQEIMISQDGLGLLRKEKTDIVFAPPDDEMYPSVFSSWVDVEKITERLEGASRPGHFRGVTTIVAKLFNIVQPTRAYFGQKDAQQVVVIKRMAADLNMDLEIVTVPTVRESDGLAMSSRNIHLSPKERQAATVLFKALALAQSLTSGGEQDAEKIRDQMAALIRTEPLAHLDYVSIADAENLEELDLLDRPAVASLAVRIGKTRLIDNIPLE